MRMFRYKLRTLMALLAMRLPQFTIRDLLWAIVVLAISVAWSIERANNAKNQVRISRLEQHLRNATGEPIWTVEPFLPSPRIQKASPDKN